MPMIEIPKDNFEEKVLKAEGKVLLDFWASWCGPCKMIAPYVEQVAEECPHIARTVTAKEITLQSRDGELTVCLDGECFHSSEIVLTLSDKKLRFFGPAGCSCNATVRGEAIHA